MMGRSFRRLGVTLAVLAAGPAARAQDAGTARDGAAGGSGRLAPWKTLTAERPQDTDEYGASVATDGERLVIGAPTSSLGAELRGAGFVHRRDLGGPGAWGPEAVILPPSASVWNFGRVVAIAGDVLVVGEPGEPGPDQPGTVYVYTRDGEGTWTPRRALRSDVAIPGKRDMFGFALGLEGDTLAVGAYFTGHVYIYRRNEGGTERWGPTHKLFPPQRVVADAFAQSLALRGDLLVVGAPYDPHKFGFGGAGAAYVFERQRGAPETWTQIARLAPEDAMPNAQFAFGHQVAVGGPDLIAVGAPTRPGPNPQTRGAIYLFTTGGVGNGGWRSSQILSSEGHREVGYLFAMDGARLVARGGLPFQAPNVFALFERATTDLASWRYVESTPPLGAPHVFGLALAGDLLAAGTRDRTGPGQVGLYHFQRGLVPAPPDAGLPDALPLDASPPPDASSPADAAVVAPAADARAIEEPLPDAGPPIAAVDATADAQDARLAGAAGGCRCALAGTPSTQAPAAAGLLAALAVAVRVVRRRRYSVRTEAPNGSAGPTSS
jgi:hypothetical protein